MTVKLALLIVGLGFFLGLGFSYAATLVITLAVEVIERRRRKRRAQLISRAVDRVWRETIKQGVSR